MRQIAVVALALAAISGNAADAENIGSQTKCAVAIRIMDAARSDPTDVQAVLTHITRLLKEADERAGTPFMFSQTSDAVENDIIAAVLMRCLTRPEVAISVAVNQVYPRRRALRDELTKFVRPN